MERAYRELLGGDHKAARSALESVLSLVQECPPPDERAVPQRNEAPQRDAQPADTVRPRVSIYALGRFEVTVDGVVLSSGRKHPKRTLALLKALIALGGQRVCRSALVDALWPDIDGDMGQNALEVTLHRLRARLGVPEAIVARGGCLELDPALVWVDALAFGACGQNDLRSAPGGAWSLNVEDAFSLYRGTFLPDDRDGGWSLRMRERLRARFVRIVAEAAAALEASGRFPAAARLYERALAVDDLACVFHDGLARCLERLGRRSEAYMALERSSHLLAAAGEA